MLWVVGGLRVDCPSGTLRGDLPFFLPFFDAADFTTIGTNPTIRCSESLEYVINENFRDDYFELLFSTL